MPRKLVAELQQHAYDKPEAGHMGEKTWARKGRFYVHGHSSSGTEWPQMSDIGVSRAKRVVENALLRQLLIILCSDKWYRHLYKGLPRTLWDPLIHKQVMATATCL